MNRALLKQIKALQLGDLVRVKWFDASVGRSMGSGGHIDVPVDSYGIYLGILGEKSKHIIICQNSFYYTNGIYDVDFTAVPLVWTAEVEVLVPKKVSRGDAEKLLHSFLLGRSRTLKRRLINH